MSLHSDLSFFAMCLNPCFCPEQYLQIVVGNENLLIFLLTT